MDLTSLALWSRDGIVSCLWRPPGTNLVRKRSRLRKWKRKWKEHDDFANHLQMPVTITYQLLFPSVEKEEIISGPKHTLRKVCSMLLTSKPV
jgi:hypothetical protein